jgi:hypothetical protein
MVTSSDEGDETRQRRGIKRSFIIYDDIGGRYESYRRLAKRKHCLNGFGQNPREVVVVEGASLRRSN